MFWFLHFLPQAHVIKIRFLFVFGCAVALTACQSSPKHVTTETDATRQSLAIDASQDTANKGTPALPLPASITTPKIVAAVTSALPSYTAFSASGISQQRLALALAMEKQGYIDLSNRLLNDINIDNLSESAWDDYYEALASTNQKLGFNGLVLDWLNDTTRSGQFIDLSSRQRRLGIAVKAYQTNSQYLTATKAAIELTRISQSTSLPKETIQARHDQLWFLLTRIHDNELASIKTNEQDPIILNWLNLAQLFRQQTNVSEAQQLIKHWLTANNTHPAYQALPIGLVNLFNFAPKTNQKIAVLLPTSGALAPFGKAIFDGFMAHYYQQQSFCTNTCNNIPTVTFFASQQVKDWQQQYTFFADNAFDLVIGPLDKTNVAKALQVNNRSIPTLALNYLPENVATADAPTNKNSTAPFFQFGLSVEGEARQIAEQGHKQAFQHALVVQTNQPWADRASQAFIDRWIEQGGTLSGRVMLNSKTIYADTVKQALNINDSDNRRKDMQIVIGENVNFESRRRQDIDLIVLFSTPLSARQLVPTLAFHDAGKIPIYASHHVFEGLIDSNRDIDLETLTFTDLPWMLQKNSLNTQVTSTWPQRSQYHRLFALGADAFLLNNALDSLNALPSLQLSGNTGVLMHVDGKIWSKLTLAQFNQGQPTLMSATDELQ